jgi:hypothetical protein
MPDEVGTWEQYARLVLEKLKDLQGRVEKLENAERRYALLVAKVGGIAAALVAIAGGLWELMKYTKG